MQRKLETVSQPTERRSGKRYLPPELVIDLEADNILLRAALAKSEGDGVRRELVTQEMKHRIGNLLAVVQAVARQTFRHADAGSVEDFSARLIALAAARTLLIDSETRPAMLAEVIRDALAPHCSSGDRATISGPEVGLTGRRAHALTLALHELATNASKYGALSVEGGWIEVEWTAKGGQLAFLWKEHDGPAVVTPTRRGFGSQLVTRNLALAFGGKVEFDFAATGVEVRLHAPQTPGS